MAHSHLPSIIGSRHRVDPLQDSQLRRRCCWNMLKCLRLSGQRATMSVLYELDGFSRRLLLFCDTSNSLNIMSRESALDGQAPN
jgi:hypothetical protein